MITAHEYWFKRFGSKIAPDVTDWQQSLMAGYPHFDPAKKRPVRMGGSEPARFLISDDRVQVWAPIHPNIDLPDDIQIRPTSARKRRDWLVDVILNPPCSPFLVASVGMSGADAAFWRMTTSRDLIAFGGAAALLDGVQALYVDRSRFLEARDWFDTERVAVSDLLRLRETLRLFKTELISGEQARARLKRIKTPRSVLEAYPGDPNPTLMKLAAYAASTWQEGETA